ncbi:MAG: hypothetical protein JO197_18480 [Acidobacteria bacterium]|nr:hypothetical protein [Acidobacteriota bacterium]MBV9479091.1 hypothetical protein [Acidobacteriota bacterium]
MRSVACAVMLLLIFEDPRFVAKLTSCAFAPAATASSNAAAVRARLMTVKERAMRADYRADIAGLLRLRRELAPLVDDPELGYLAHYWSGYASWRAAINGANHHMSVRDLQTRLIEADAEFEAAMLQRTDFADAYAAASSVNGWLGNLLRDDPAVMRERFTRAARLLARARELEPDNPRVLWVAGGDLLFKPASIGGDVPKAIELYQRAVQLAPPPSHSPLPDWGKPESLMALAYAHVNATPPDLPAARAEAREALRLVPDWQYVRDVLLPRVEGAKGK